MKKFEPKVRIKFAEVVTEKSVEEWADDFIRWIEEREEKLCSVIEGVNPEDTTTITKGEDFGK